MGVDHTSRLKLMGALAHRFTFGLEQMKRLIKVFDYGQNQVEAVAVLFGQILDFDSGGDVLVEMLGTVGVTQLQQVLGGLYDFKRMLPSGHYCLGLENPHHRTLLKQLAAISQCQADSQSDVFDVSQCGDRQCFRNCMFNNTPWTQLSLGSLDKLWRGKLPVEKKKKKKKDDPPPPPPTGPPPKGPLIEPAGILEFDFVADQQPAAGQAATMNEIKFEKWCKNARKIRRNRSSELLRWVRSELVNHFITVDQVLIFLEAVASDDSSKADLMMACWTRILDRDLNGHKLLLQFPPATAQRLRRQIGWIKLFNPLEVEKPYSMDLAIRDERLVAIYILEVAQQEAPGEDGLVLPIQLRAEGAEEAVELKNVPEIWWEEFPLNVPTTGVVTIWHETKPAEFNQTARLEQVMKQLQDEGQDDDDEDLIEEYLQDAQHAHSDAQRQKLAPMRSQLAQKRLGITVPEPPPIPTKVPLGLRTD